MNMYSVSLGVFCELQVAWDHNTVLVIRCNSLVLLVQVVQEHMKCCINIVRRASDPDRHRQHDSLFLCVRAAACGATNFLTVCNSGVIVDNSVHKLVSTCILQ